MIRVDWTDEFETGASTAMTFGSQADQGAGRAGEGVGMTHCPKTISFYVC